EGTNAYHSYCYYFNEYFETWVDADLYCQNMHLGHLVSILTEAEGAFIASLIKESGTPDCHVWIGHCDPQKYKKWKDENCEAKFCFVCKFKN
uniref:C-type lectin domain-containing protein n=1 Tax=Propithecus coquereli TaxID=379532 RepID=A0A2K6FIP9_PROCO